MASKIESDDLNAVLESLSYNGVREGDLHDVLRKPELAHAVSQMLLAGGPLPDSQRLASKIMGGRFFGIPEWRRYFGESYDTELEFPWSLEVLRNNLAPMEIGLDVCESHCGFYTPALKESNNLATVVYNIIETYGSKELVRFDDSAMRPMMGVHPQILSAWHLVTVNSVQFRGITDEEWEGGGLYGKVLAGYKPATLLELLFLFLMNEKRGGKMIVPAYAYNSFESECPLYEEPGGRQVPLDTRIVFKYSPKSKPKIEIRELEKDDLPRVVISRKPNC